MRPMTAKERRQRTRFAIEALEWDAEGDDVDGESYRHALRIIRAAARAARAWTRARRLDCVTTTATIRDEAAAVVGKRMSALCRLLGEEGK